MLTTKESAAPALSKTGIKDVFPILRHTASYKPRDYAMDMIAGLIIAVVLVPETIAYASIAGLRPEVGLYTAVIAYLTYGMFGPSRQLVVAPVSILSLMVGAALGAENYTEDQYMAAAVVLAFLVGMILFIMGRFKAGYLENLLSKPVATGFVTAGAIIVATTQLPHLLGLEIHTASGSLKTLDTIRQCILNIGGTEWVPLAIGLVGIAAIQLSKRISPFIPGALVNILFGVGIMYLACGGLDTGKVDIVGSIPPRLPGLALPWSGTGEGFLAAMQSIHIGTLLAIAPGIALVNFVESISIAKVMAIRNGDRVDANRELEVLGLANIAASFFGAYPAAGSLSKTSVSFQAGSRSQIAGLTAVFTVVMILLFLTPYLYYVPKACLAAIVFVAAYHLFEWDTIQRAFKLSRSEGWLIVATLILTLLIGVEYGVLAGIVISFGLFIWKTARPQTYRLGRIGDLDFTYVPAGFEGVKLNSEELILRIDGPIYFASVNYVEEQIINMLADNPDVKRVIIDMKGVNSIDLSGDRFFWDLLKTLILKEYDLALAGVNKPVADLMKASGFYDFLEPELFFASVPDAVAHFGGYSSASV